MSAEGRRNPRVDFSRPTRLQWGRVRMSAEGIETAPPFAPAARFNGAASDERGRTENVAGNNDPDVLQWGRVR